MSNFNDVCDQSVLQRADWYAQLGVSAEQLRSSELDAFLLVRVIS